MPERSMDWIKQAERDSCFIAQQAAEKFHEE